MFFPDDIGINRLASDGVQVFDAGDWLNRLNIPFRHFGTGMSSDDVADLSQAVDIDVLWEYHQLVGQRTIEVLKYYPANNFNRELEDAQLHKVLGEEEAALETEVTNVFNSYQGMTRGWVLMHLGLTHTFQHIGEATTIASLQGTQRI